MPIAAQLQRYTKALCTHRNYWQFVAFTAAGAQHTSGQCFVQGWPQSLQEALWQLTDAEVAQLDASPTQLQHFFRPWFKALLDLPAIATPSHKHIDEPPFWLTNGIGGRKLEQIRAFLGHIPEATGQAVEWCAGKGHLGRLFAYTQQREVTSIEWQAQLCEQGRALAHQHQLPQQFLHANVLAEGLVLAEPLAQAVQAFALHACGDLHVSLIEQAASAGCQALYIAPCCYHLTQRVPFTGVSQAGQMLFQQQQLQLSAHDLKLAVQGQVTAGERVAKLRHTEVHWRLAYQCLREALTGDASYRPLASVSKSWFTGTFAEFARWAATQHGLEVPPQCDWPKFLAAGAVRAQTAARLELVRHVFRRPLESLLVLDRAMWLVELGYEVGITEFCDYQHSPRNFLLKAQRKASLI